MTDYTTLLELHDQRGEIVARLNQAKAELAAIDERIRMEGGNPEPDFSGAVTRLRNKGILPDLDKSK